MGNCHSKSDDHHGRDGYSSSTEKLNPRPYYTTQITINVPPGQAGGAAGFSQRQQRQQSQPKPQQPQFQQQQQQQQQPQKFSSPPKGKRRPPNPKPEYDVHIKCKFCEKNKRRCITATDLNMQKPTAYRDPTYRGSTPRDTWELEVDFCDVASWPRRTTAEEPAAWPGDRNQNMVQKKKVVKPTPEEVLKRFVKDVDDLGAPRKPFAVDELLQALDEAGVWKKSSL